MGNNCLRTGHDCLGYRKREQPNPDQKQVPIPLLSKSDYVQAGYTQSTFIAPLEGQGALDQEGSDPSAGALLGIISGSS
jgi:hypothetical protein